MGLGNANIAPLYDVVIPSTKKKVKFRPFLVKEERALLTAQESEDVRVMISTLSQVVANCVQPPQENLSTFDVEYLFVQIRSKSVGEISTLVFPCDNCDGPNSKMRIELDLRKVFVHVPEGHTTKIELSPKKIAQMKYPSIDDIERIKDTEDKELAKREAIKACIATVFIGEETYHISEEPEEELNKFLDTLQSNEYAKLEDFIRNMPETRADVEWTCPDCGHKHKKVLRGINSFF